MTAGNPMDSGQGERPHLHAMFLDDDTGQAHLLARILGMLDWADVDLHHFSKPEMALAPLVGGKIDLLFLDHHLGGRRNGLDVLIDLREAGFDGPIVMLTNRDEEALVKQYLVNGADAYLCKSQLDVGRISSVMRIAMTRPHRNTTPRILKAEDRGLRS